LRLIEEVNNQKQNNNYRESDRDADIDQQVIPREGNIGVRSSLIDYNNSSGVCSEANLAHIHGKKTRA